MLLAVHMAGSALAHRAEHSALLLCGSVEASLLCQLHSIQTLLS